MGKRWLAFGAVWLLAFRPGWRRSGAVSRRAKNGRAVTPRTVGRGSKLTRLGLPPLGGMIDKPSTPVFSGRHSLVCPSAPSLFTPTYSSDQQKYSPYLRVTSQKITNILIIQ